MLFFSSPPWFPRPPPLFLTVIVAAASFLRGSVSVCFCLWNIAYISYIQCSVLLSVRLFLFSVCLSSFLPSFRSYAMINSNTSAPSANKRFAEIYNFVGAVRPALSLARIHLKFVTMSLRSSRILFHIFDSLFSRIIFHSIVVWSVRSHSLTFLFLFYR